MTDDLVKRLREVAAENGIGGLPAEAADRIEKLETELAKTFKSMMAEAKRVETLEAALRLYSCDCDRICKNHSEINECGHTARTAIAGEKKDD